MKKLYTLTIVVLLAGCSWFAPEFDNVEYKELAELHTHAHYLQTECISGFDFDTQARLQQMKFKSATLLTYASYLRDNEEVIEFTKIIDNDINELITKANTGMSETYCELKAKQLIIKLDRILEAIGNLQNVYL